MTIRGPLVTLGAVAVVGGGLWLANVSREPAATAPAQPAAEAAATTPTPAGPTPSAPVPLPAPAFPAHADYVGKIPVSRGVITLDITVDGERAIAYVCDGNSIEAWLHGSAKNGAVSLKDKAGTSRLEGRLAGSSVNGTLWIAQKKWDFRATPALPPAGLYTYEESGTRTTWIIDQNKSVTGVQRLPDGSTSPAPWLSPDGTAVLGGRTIAVTRVEADGDVS